MLIACLSCWSDSLDLVGCSHHAAASCSTYAPRGVARYSCFRTGQPGDDVMAFYGDAATVRPLAFAATIKDMKGLLHNG